MNARANGGVEPQTAHELAVDSIYTALLQLMGQKPYKDISITDICQRAGVSRMAYYRNYQGKDEIITKRIDEVFDSLRNRLMAGEWKNPEAFWDAFFAEFADNPIARAALQAGLIDSVLEAHKRFTFEVYGSRFGWNLSDEGTVMRLYHSMGGVVGLLRYCAERGGKVDRKAVVEMAAKGA